MSTCQIPRSKTFEGNAPLIKLLEKHFESTKERIEIRKAQEQPITKGVLYH
jgi:hypothetical protein